MIVDLEKIIEAPQRMLLDTMSKTEMRSMILDESVLFILIIIIVKSG